MTKDRSRRCHARAGREDSGTVHTLPEVAWCWAWLRPWLSSHLPAHHHSAFLSSRTSPFGSRSRGESSCASESLTTPLKIFVAIPGFALRLFSPPLGPPKQNQPVEEQRFSRVPPVIPQLRLTTKLRTTPNCGAGRRSLLVSTFQPRIACRVYAIYTSAPKHLTLKAGRF